MIHSACDSYYDFENILIKIALKEEVYNSCEYIYVFFVAALTKVVFEILWPTEHFYS